MLAVVCVSLLNFGKSFAAPSYLKEFQRSNGGGSPKSPVNQETFMKTYDRKFLTVPAPKDTVALSEFDARMEECLSALNPIIWDCESVMTPEEVRDGLKPILDSFHDVHSEGLRRSMIYGLFNQIHEVFNDKDNSRKLTRLFGISMIEAVRVVNEIIPESFFQSAQVDEMESRKFKYFISTCVAHAWIYDFNPTLEVLSDMRYVHSQDDEPLVILIRRQKYGTAHKMINAGAATICDGSNSWVALIEAVESPEKYNFIKNLLADKSISMDWKYKNLNFVQIAIRSKKELLSTISTTIKQFRSLGVTCTEYLAFARLSIVRQNHSLQYQLDLERTLESLIVLGY